MNFKSLSLAQQQQQQQTACSLLQKVLLSLKTNSSTTYLEFFLNFFISLKKIGFSSRYLEKNGIFKVKLAWKLLRK
jgi:hypothetical protein